MKNLIIVIILGVAGYFAYQYFIGSSQQFSTTAKPTFNMYSLPEKCQRHGENLKAAISRHEISANINGYTKHLRNCLRLDGYTKPEIDDVCDQIKDSR